MEETEIMEKSKEEQSRREKAARSAKPWYREWSEALIVAFVIAMILRTFVVQAFKIPSGSMEDTLLVGDHLLVNKFVYGMQIPFTDIRILPIRAPRRGDVIVFEFPEDSRDSSLHFWQRRDFIKRVVGTPGDTVAIRDKQVFVNGEPYRIPQEVHKDPNVIPSSPYCEVGFPRPNPCRDSMAPTQVPLGQYFVMGDNRDRSYDSRFWGFVPEEKIKGLAFIKYWSWNSKTHWPRWGRIGRPIH